MTKAFYTALLFLYLGTYLKAQTLVDEVGIDSISQPAFSSSYEVVTADSTAGYLIADEVLTGVQSGYVIAKVSNSSGVVWLNQINNAPGKQIFLTGLYQQGANIYSTGYLLDSSSNQSSIYVAGFSKSTGDTLWTRTYFSGSWYSSGAAVIVSDSGFIFVVGTASVSANNYKMILLKYNSLGNLISSGGFDSVNMYSGGVAIALGPGGGVVVTGFTGSGFGSWNFVSASFSSSCNLTSYATSSNGSGSFISRPVAIFRDGLGSIRVVGTAATSGTGSQVKLIEYDSSFTQQKVSTFGDSVGSTVVATNAINDQNGHILVTGSASNTSGGTDMIALNFLDSPGDSSDGTLNWGKRISAPDPSQPAVGASLTTDGNNNAVVSGKVFNNGHWGMVTNNLDINSGSLIWQKTYKRETTTDDSATTVIFDGQYLDVFGTSVGPTNTIYNMVQYAEWTATPCTGPKGGTSCVDITYNFKNGQITHAGTDTFVEFDIYAKQSNPYVGFSGADIYFTYSTSVFGKLIADSNEITVTKGIIINDTTTYLRVVNDTLLKSDAVPPGGGEIHIGISALNDSNLYFIADTLQQLCHVKMKRKALGNPGVHFDQFYMENQSFFNTGSDVAYINVYTGWPLPYSDGASDDVGITYRIDPFTIQLSSNRLTFHIQGQTNNPDNVTAKFQDGSIPVSFNVAAFDSNLVFMGAVSDSAIGNISALDISGNPLYIVSVSDDSAANNEFIITIAPSVNYDPLQAFEITTGPGFDDMVSVTMIIAHCDSAGNIALNAAGGNDYDNDVAGTEDFSSVGVIPAPGTVTNVLCPPCSSPSITGIATSLDPEPSTSASIPAGTQDELLIITGCGFGSNPGNVFFTNATLHDGTPFTHTDTLDIQLWTDTKIQLYVPSVIGGVPQATSHPAGTGPFYVQTSDSIIISSTVNNINLTIPYAVQNWRAGYTAVQFLVQQSAIYTSCLYCNGDSSSGYLFTLQDPNITTNTDAFSSSQINNVNTSFNWDVEQWVCNTGVSFSINGLYDELNTQINQLDHNDMILSSAPDGNAWNLPLTSIACTHSGFASNCLVTIPIPNTSYTHTFYVTTIDDIDIVFDNTETGANYDYVLNDADVDISHTLFTTSALHELGHASQLDHVLPGTGEIMYYGFPKGPGAILTYPYLTTNDVAGGEFVLTTVGADWAVNDAGTTPCTYKPNMGNAYCTLLDIDQPDPASINIKVYPNPFENSFTTSFTLTETVTVVLSIYDILGQLVYYKQFGNLPSGTHTYNVLFPHDANPGVYVLKMKINEIENSIKVIKE